MIGARHVHMDTLSPLETFAQGMSLSMKLLLLAATLLVLSEHGHGQQHDLTIAATDTSSSKKDQEETEKDEETPTQQFQPTKEWKEVQPGEILQRGLHVRINLATGKKEAKLLDRNEPIKEGRDNAAPEEDKLLLAHVKDKPSTKLPDKDGIAWNMEELKKKMSSLKLQSKSESEILKGLLKHYQNATAAGKEPLLRDIEFLVHQYDTAVDFIRMDGLVAIAPDLNSTSETVRELVAFTLGSALQGNPEVQSIVLDVGLLPQLLRLVATDASPRVRSRCLFAISCLVRNLPSAQDALLNHGGISVLAGLFSAANTSPKLHLKAVTLIHDLMVEQRLRQGAGQLQDNRLSESIQSYGFCSFVPRLLQSPDVDTQEKVVQAMLSLVDTCHHEFQAHLSELHSLLNSYQREVNSQHQAKELEHTWDYFEGLYHSVLQLVESLDRKQKDEL